MATVGILGGSFDPIHYGHLRLAEEAREAWPLDKVILIPAQVSPLKLDSAPTSPAHRLAMVRAAVADRGDLEVSDWEILRDGPSYTVDTLAHLRETRPNDQFVLIMGMDALRTFPRWRNWERIVELSHLFVGARPGEPWVDPLSALSIESPGFICYDDHDDYYRFKTGLLLRFFTSTPLDISATAVRALAASGRSLRYLTPPTVIDYIHTHGLYRNRG